ncbi:MAG: GNAT family N-acetyltransferase, partial [Micromonosporaceae bacterium]
MTLPDVLTRIERGYDQIARQQGRCEPYGPLVLFVQEGPGHPLYARPTPAAAWSATADDIATVRARQRELGVPETFEWLHDADPALLGIAEASGLQVLRAPLLVLDPASLPAPSAPVRVLDPDDPSYPRDLAYCKAIGTVGFGNPGTASGNPGAAERDAATTPPDPTTVAAEAARTRAGEIARALLVSDADGPVATGALLRGGDVAEIGGVATLPTARRQGLGAAVTAALARSALKSGVDLVFISAGSEDIARI